MKTKEIITNGTLNHLNLMLRWSKCPPFLPSDQFFLYTFSIALKLWNYIL